MWEVFAGAGSASGPGIPSIHGHQKAFPVAGEGLPRKAVRDRGRDREARAAFPERYFEMSTSFVSGRKNVPITRVIAATMTGYHRPE